MIAFTHSGILFIRAFYLVQFFPLLFIKEHLEKTHSEDPVLTAGIIILTEVKCQRIWFLR